MLPKLQLQAMYEEAVREPFSFLYIYLLNPRDQMFHLRFERRFAVESANGSAPVDGDVEAAGEQHLLPK